MEKLEKYLKINFTIPNMHLNQVVERVYSAALFGKKLLTGKPDNFLFLDMDDSGNYLLDGKVVDAKQVGDLKNVAVYESDDYPIKVNPITPNIKSKIQTRMMYLHDVVGLDVNAVYVRPLLYLVDFIRQNPWDVYYQPLSLKNS
ncbi:hypothetical protein J4480_06065 [Candidatus Woesearchaeota archaeon]|nr:hypothetical protein [Candidatus Woesearchaeota archaeon]